MRMKIIFISLLSVLFVKVSLAQAGEKDSLIRVLQQTADTNERYKLLNKLASLLVILEKPEKSKIYLEELKELAHQRGDYKNEAKTYRAFSMIYQNAGMYEKSIEQINKAIEIDERIDCLDCYLLDINQLGRIYIDMQMPEKAIKVYNKGIQKAGNNNNRKVLRALSIIYGNLGIAYGKMHQNEKEINSFLKQVELAERTFNINEKIKALYNIGYAYMEMEQYPKAEKYFLRCLADSLKIKKDYVNINYHALGILYSRWKKYDKALHYDSLALDAYRKEGYKIYEFDVLNNMAGVYQRMGDYEKALPYHYEAIRLADSLHHNLIRIGGRLSYIETLIDLKKFDKAERILNQVANDTVDTLNFNKQMRLLFLNFSYKIFKYKHQYKKALYAFEKYVNLDKELNKTERDIKITEIETKYQAEKKEKENQRLLAEQYKQEAIIQQKTKQNILLAGGFGAALAVAGVFGFFYNRNRRQKRLIESLQKDLHHRVKNNLGIISSLVEEIKNEFDTPELGARLNDLHTRIMSIHKIHEQLYKEKNVYALGLKEYLEKLVENVRKTYGRDDVKIDIDVDGKIKVNPLKSFPLGLIVAEFLSNSFKHAFKDSRHPGHIAIKVEQKGGQYVLKLKDNGSGPEQAVDLERAGSYGIRIMRGMARQMKAHLKLYYDQGMNMELAFG